MILQELANLYDRLAADPEIKIPGMGWSVENVSYRIRIDDNGRTTGVIPYVVGEGKEQRRFVKRIVPEHASRTSGIQPFFLCDNGCYLFGLGKTRGEEKFSASAALHKKVLAESNNPAARAVLAFFDRGPQAYELSSDDAGVIASTFVVLEYAPENKLIHEMPDIARLWDLYRAATANADATKGQCAITGEHGSIARLYPQVTGFPGAQSAGASLVSFNCSAFESYGKRGTYNASISETAAFKSGTALRYLSKDDSHRVSIGDSLFICWTDGPILRPTGVITALLGFKQERNGSRAEDARALDQVRGDLQSIRQGYAPMPSVPSTKFYMVGVAPNAARLSIRYFKVESYGKLAENLIQYLNDIEMVDVKPTSLKSLLRQTAPLGEGAAIPSTLLHGCFDAMLGGSLFPRALQASVLTRMRADHASRNRWDMGQRAALLKGCLNRQIRKNGAAGEKEYTVSLDRENANQGYVLGRLFAVIERAQRAALGDGVNATVRDKYIGAASTTPARVFPRLLANCQNHLSKIEKMPGKRGMAVGIQKDLDEIVGKLNGNDGLFPRTLGMNDQGAFFIGYYQQRQSGFVRKEPEEHEVVSSVEE